MLDTIKIIGSPLYQWEIGRKVAITHPAKTKLSKVEFAHKGDTETLPVFTKEENGVIVADVPNILLQSAEHIFVYLLYTDENCLETTLFRILPVISRPKPADYVYTETEVMTWKALDKRLQDLEGEGLANAVAEYLAENPIEAGATEEEAAQIAQNKEDIEKLNTDKLPEAVNDALAQAKASGEFDGDPGIPGQPGEKGDPGYTPVKGVDYFDGKDGQPGADGRTPVKGVDYFTESDKQEIAGRAAGMVEVPASNWNARPGAPGHILNRTHWVEVTKGEEIPVDGFWSNNNGTEYQFVFISPINLEIGKSYVVEWDGVEYQCTASEIEYQGVGAVGIGNTALIGGEDTGEPFGIMELIADGALRCFAFAVTPGAVPFSIYHGTEVVHKLDAKYLDIPTDEHINSLIDAKLGVIENGTY